MTTIPSWPRILSRDQAATYVGVSTTLFDREVAAGKWPPPVRRGEKGGRLTWDRLALDRAADALYGDSIGPGQTLDGAQWGRSRSPSRASGSSQGGSTGDRPRR